MGRGETVDGAKDRATGCKVAARYFDDSGNTLRWSQINRGRESKPGINVSNRGTADAQLSVDRHNRVISSANTLRRGHRACFWRPCSVRGRILAGLWLRTNEARKSTQKAPKSVPQMQTKIPGKITPKLSSAGFFPPTGGTVVERGHGQGPVMLGSDVGPERSGPAEYGFPRLRDLRFRHVGWDVGGVSMEDTAEFLGPVEVIGGVKDGGR